MATIGENLARIRRRAGLTQEQLTEQANVSVSVIRKLERGDCDRASLPTLRKLASALNVTTVDLFHPVPAFSRVSPNDRDDTSLSGASLAHRRCWSNSLRKNRIHLRRTTLYLDLISINRPTQGWAGLSTTAFRQPKQNRETTHPGLAVQAARPLEAVSGSRDAGRERRPCLRRERQDRSVRVLAVPDEYPTGQVVGHLDAGTAVGVAAAGLAPSRLGHDSLTIFMIRSRDWSRGRATPVIACHARSSVPTGPVDVISLPSS